MNRPRPPLTDISDDDFRRRLEPLEKAVLPPLASPNPVRVTPSSLRREGGSRKRGVEVLLPERVVDALKLQALHGRVSMSHRVLEILREAGLPVEDEDFIDLRKQPRR